ncbi:MAG: S41 family peptidase [Clostridiales bacterium]|nr:S41 family peptidase [Clostridiales bacterium]
MISKKKAALVVIVFMMIASLATFVFMSIYPLNGRVMLSANEYNTYRYILKEYGKLFELRRYIEENYYIPVDSEDLKVGMYKGLFEGIGDPYSAYLTKEEYDELMISTSGEYKGIGVTVAPGTDGFILVIAPIEDTPAERAGIKSGDKIVKINGKEYTADQMDDAVANMRGEPGTKVTISVLRQGEEGLLDFEIIRANVQLKTVKSEILNKDIGYIRITSFESKTYEDFTNHLRDLQLKNIQGLVIDLRDNPGGLVDQSVKIADKLLGKGVIVYTEDRKGNREYHKSDSSKIDIPYVILVNGGTASASEILAAGVKDNKSGTIIGTKTFGKGIIQRIAPLENGDGVELTIAQYFSPEGHVIHNIGIEPDILVEIDNSKLEGGILTRENDPQLKKALEVLKTNN